MLEHEFKLKPSRVYITLLTVILLSTSGILVMLPIVFWLKFATFILLFFYGFHIFWKFGLLKSKHAIIGFKHLTQNKFQISTVHKKYEATLCKDSVATQLLSVLRFQIAESSWLKPSCIVLADSLEQGIYRRLLIVLRLGPG